MWVESWVSSYSAPPLASHAVQGFQLKDQLETNVCKLLGHLYPGCIESAILKVEHIQLHGMPGLALAVGCLKALQTVFSYTWFLPFPLAQSTDHVSRHSGAEELSPSGYSLFSHPVMQLERIFH